MSNAQYPKKRPLARRAGFFQQNNRRGNGQRPPLKRTEAGSHIFGTPVTRHEETVQFLRTADQAAQKHNKPIYVRLMGRNGGNADTPSLINMMEVVGIMSFTDGRPSLFTIWAAAVATEPGKTEFVLQRFPAPKAVLQDAHDQIMAFTVFWTPLFGFMWSPRTLEADGFQIMATADEEKVPLLNMKSFDMVPIKLVNSKEAMGHLAAQRVESGTDVMSFKQSIWHAHHNIHGGDREDNRYSFLEKLQTAGLPALPLQTGIRPFVQRRLGKELFEQMLSEINAEWQSLHKTFPPAGDSEIIHGKTQGATAALMASCVRAGFIVPLRPNGTFDMSKIATRTPPSDADSWPEATMEDLGYTLEEESPADAPPPPEPQAPPVRVPEHAIGRVTLAAVVDRVVASQHAALAQLPPPVLSVGTPEPEVEAPAPEVAPAPIAEPVPADPVAPTEVPEPTPAPVEAPVEPVAPAEVPQPAVVPVAVSVPAAMQPVENSPLATITLPPTTQVAAQPAAPPTAPAKYWCRAPFNWGENPDDALQLTIAEMRQFIPETPDLVVYMGDDWVPVAKLIGGAPKVSAPPAPPSVSLNNADSAGAAAEAATVAHGG